MEDIHRLASSLRWKLLRHSYPSPKQEGTNQDEHRHHEEVPDIPDVADATRELVMKVSKAQTELQRLRLENKELMTKSEQRIAQMHAKNAELNALREELRQIKAEKTHLQHLYESLGQDTTKDDYLLTLLRNEIQLLKTSLDAVAEDHHLGREEHLNLCSLHDEAVKKITSMGNELAMKNEMLQQLKSRVEKAEQLLQEGERERQELLASVALLSIRLGDQEDRLSKADSAVSLMEEQISTYQRQIDGLRTQVSELEHQKSLSTETMIKLQETCALADSNHQQLLLDKERDIAALQCRLIELTSNMPLSSGSDTFAAIPAREFNPEPAVTLTPTRTKPAAAVIDASSDSECTCATCNEPPYGVMIVCESCQREHHSSCAKKSGILRGK